MYLSKYEIHLENALSELRTVQNLTPYIQINPYKEKLKLAEDYTGLLPEDARRSRKTHDAGGRHKLRIQETDRVLAKLKAERTELEAKREPASGSCPSRSNRFRICPAAFPRCWTSGSSSSGSARFRKTIIRNLKIISMKIQRSVFYQCHSDSQYIWGIYFCPKDQISKIDAVYASMHFERIYLPNEYEGTPEEAYQSPDHRKGTGGSRYPFL